MSLVDIHARLANTLLLYVIILAVWGLWRYLRHQGVDSNYWGALAISEVVIVIQGLLGASLWFINALRPEAVDPYLYGSSVHSPPLVYVYTKAVTSAGI
jgi:uncharacterized protein YybS (DUF2232 family)